MIPGISCTKCGTEISASSYNKDGFTACPSCSAPLLIRVYPALYYEDDIETAGTVSDGQAACFYHPDNVAASSCDSCGRFLCSTCEIEIDGMHICPSCFEAGRKKSLIKNLDSERMLFDSISLKLSFYPLLIFPFTIFTAPVSLYLAVRYFRRPSSILSHSKYKYILAMLSSSVQILAWAGLFVAVFI